MSTTFWQRSAKVTGVLAASLAIASVYSSVWMFYTWHAIKNQRQAIEALSSSKQDESPPLPNLQSRPGLASAPDWSIIAPQAQAATVFVEVGDRYRHGRDSIAGFSANPILNTAHEVYQRIQGRKDDSEWKAAGAGVFVGSGVILTAAHVTNEHRRFRITTATGQQHIATLLGADEKQDIAILKIDGKAPAVAPLAETSRLPAGSPVIAVGSPIGEPFVVTAGVLMSTNQRHEQSVYADYVQTDAGIRGGSSGGGVFNRAGELLGIVSFGNDFAGYAVPVERVRDVLNKVSGGATK